MRTRPYRLAVIAFDEMDLLDVAGPLEACSSAGRKWNWRAVKADVIATREGPVATRAQLSVANAQPLSACPEPELLLIPGGYGARHALADHALLEYLSRVGAGLTLTLAVGLGTLVAARAGLLRDAEVATTHALRDELQSLDPSLTPRITGGAVVSPRAITAAQSGAAIELGLELISRLLGKKQAVGTAQELGFAWGTETIAIELKP